MKRILAILAMLALAWPGAAQADKVLWLSNGSGGSDTDHESTPTNPFKTMQYVNAHAGEGSANFGDIQVENVIVMMLPTAGAGFSTFPNPTFVAVDSTIGRYYFYGNIANPSQVKMPGGDLTAKNISIRGVHFTSTLGLESGASGDTIADYDTNSNAFVSVFGGDFNWIGRGINRNNEFNAGYGIGNNSHGNTFSSVSFPNLGAGHTGFSHIFVLGGGGGCASEGCGRLYNTTFEFCRFNFQMVHEGDGSKHFMMLYSARSTVFRHCRMEYVGSLEQPALHARDSTGLTMIGDTLLAFGTACNILLSTGSGAMTGSYKPIVIDSCYMVAEYGDGFWPRDPVQYPITITHSLLAAGSSSAFKIKDNIYGKITLRRNTFIGHPFKGILHFDEQTTMWADTVKIMDNIIASAVSGVSGMHSPPTCGNESTPGCYWWGLFLGKPQEMDSIAAGGGAASRKHIINRNLYSYFGDSIPNTGDRSISPGNLSCSRPGSGASSWFFARYKQDSASVYGGPAFDKGEHDTTIAAFLNPDNDSWEIGQFSNARGMASGGADCGARSYEAGTADGGVVSGSHLIFDYGEVEAQTFTVRNFGTGDMSVTSVISDNPGFVATPQTATIAAGAEQVFTVTYNGSALGSANIFVLSNSISTVSVLVQLFGEYGGSTSKYPSGDEPPSP